MTAAITGPATPPRDENVSTTPAARPVRGTPFIPAGRQLCCQQKAFRPRHPALAAPAPAARLPGRAARTCQCGECDQRYLGEQWCHDRTRPRRAPGPGGYCPCRGEPVAISDLQQETP